MKNTLLVLGYGYTARAFAGRVLAKGWRVFGTTRDAQKSADITAQGGVSLLWPQDIDAVKTALSQATHLLASAAPNEQGDPFIEALGGHIGRASHLDWVGYLSTIGVYGDQQGGWVDENTPATPISSRGQQRLKAERQWLETDLPVHIFRLGGIYGPGRGPFEKVKNGTARRIVKPGQFFSRIHVEDIAEVLTASIHRPAPGAIYNVCDTEPASPEDVISYAADLLGMPPPPLIDFEHAELSPMARAFYSESKRARSLRLGPELGVSLRYPTYREGLRALLQDEQQNSPQKDNGPE